MRVGIVRAAASLALVVAASAAVQPALAARASTGVIDDSTRTAEVQALLDRVLGPGASVVAVRDEVGTSTTEVSSTTSTGGTPLAESTRRMSGGGLRSSSTSVQRAADGTTTISETPPGTLLRQDVTVVVDPARLAGRGAPALRRIVAGAAGVVPARGDRLTVVVARLAASAPAVTPADPFAPLLRATVPAIWSGGALIALALLVVALRRRRPAH